MVVFFNDYKYQYHILDLNILHIFVSNHLVSKWLTSVILFQMIRSAPLASLFHGQPFRAGETDKPGAGTVKLQPHNLMHAWVGDLLSYPNAEDMGAYYAAGRDPIFYTHHANIDRLWDVWRNIGKGEDFTDPDWLNSSCISLLWWGGPSCAHHCPWRARHGQAPIHVSWCWFTMVGCTATHYSQREVQSEKQDREARHVSSNPWQCGDRRGETTANIVETAKKGNTRGGASGRAHPDRWHMQVWCVCQC